MPEELAEQACHIEIERLGEPIGKQDQYIAAYGGITCFRFQPSGKVDAWPLQIEQDTLFGLEDNLLLFFTGYSRAASNILREQDVKSRGHDKDMTENLHFIKEIGRQSMEALEAGDLAPVWRTHERALGTQEEALVEHEQLADRRVVPARPAERRGWREAHRRRRWWVPDVLRGQTRLACARSMREAGLQEVRFRFDFEGTTVVTQS